MQKALSPSTPLVSCPGGFNTHSNTYSEYIPAKLLAEAVVVADLVLVLLGERHRGHLRRTSNDTDYGAAIPLTNTVSLQACSI